MSHTEFCWQNAQGLKIAAQDWQPEGAIHGAVALVHGLGEHTGRYAHIAQSFNAAGYALTGFDLTGHGGSDGPRGHASYDSTLDDIACLLEEVADRYPEQPCFLYGHSLGGALVLYYALKRRPNIKGVIATSPGLAPSIPLPGAKLALAKVMARLAPSLTLANGLDLNNLSHDAAVIQAYTDDPLVHERVSARLGMDLLNCGVWIQAHAAEFPLPLLLMVGSDDHLVSTDAIAAFARAMPQEKLTYKVWEGLFHEIHNEFQKQQVIGYMIDWLAGRLT